MAAQLFTGPALLLCGGGVGISGSYSVVGTATENTTRGFRLASRTVGAHYFDAPFYGAD